MNKKIYERIIVLQKSSQDILASATVTQSKLTNTSGTTIDKFLFIKWRVQVKDLISKICGVKSTYYLEFEEANKAKGYDQNFEIFIRINAIFQGFCEDYKSGYLDSFKNLVQADIFESELEQANELLKKGYKSAAAVIAGVVLETSIRDLCISNKIDIGKLNKMNADLVKGGVYNMLLSKKITALADIRNSAAHGKVDEFSHDDVKNMLRDIEQFLINQLS